MSAEFVESFVIWLYGVTNVFLEHLAAWGDMWTPQDLEHISISVMFFSGGLVSTSTCKTTTTLTDSAVWHAHRINDSPTMAEHLYRDDT